MNNSESGRKLNQAVNNTTKVVGGAISQAKGAFSVFWSSFTAPTVATTAIPADNFEPDDDSVEIPEETPEDCDGIIKQLARKFQQNEPQLNLKEEKDLGIIVNEGVVEIGREAKIIDSNRKGDVFDV